GREVTKARGQADRLEQAAQGALAQVTEETSTMMEPEETRRRAERQAPPGLCDDEELQHPASYACPLDIPQRAILRERVANKITTLAQDWKDAIRSCELDDRFAALN